jgi:hypothetical protein
MGDIDGFGLLSAFSWPVGMSVVGSWLYVTESGNNDIRAIAL